MTVLGCRSCGRRIGTRHAATCLLMDVIDPWVIWRLMQRDRAQFSRMFHGETLSWRTHWLGCARQLGGKVAEWHCTAWMDAPDPTITAIVDGQVHELDGARVAPGLPRAAPRGGRVSGYHHTYRVECGLILAWCWECTCGWERRDPA